MKNQLINRALTAKTKKLFTLLLAVAASVGTMFADGTKIGDLYYNLNATEKTAKVTYELKWDENNYKGLTSANIPASVEYNSVAYSVTSIGEDAFYNCSGLTSVTIGNSVTSIGDDAFRDCSSLTSVTIPNSVTSIGKRAFEGCTVLISVTIPNSVTSIGTDAFRGCSGLTSIIVENGNSFYDSRNNCNAIIETATNTLIVGCMNTIIPNSVTTIGGWTFYYCTGLTSVTIPKSVTSIGDGAFAGCSGLTSIEIPNSVTSIEPYAFYNCSGLTSVTIPNSVTTIGESAFSSCTGLTSVTIPNSVTSIGEYAFGWCTGLTSVTIGNSVTSISYAAFSVCTGLTAIYVPCGELERFKQLLSKYSNIIKYAPRNIETIAENGIISLSNDNITICDESVEITAAPNYGYHFTQWSDGITDNPRTIELTQDTAFTAEFAKNEYTITTESANSEWGTTAGGKSALYLDEIEISATPNYGYHFVRWNDNNTSNPRTVSVTEDKTFTATFAKNVYSITKNAEHGTISGNSSAEYLDFVTLTVTPDYGYHFTQWSDGLKDNPRIAQITQDTTFTAEYAYDRVGTCGKDMALVWSYDPTNKVLTIGNAGEFTENMQFGAEAPGEMEELVIGNNVTAIGENAFAGISTLKKVSIGESVKTIYDRAFYNCENLETIFNYRQTPTNAYSTAFDGVDKFECKLYVLPNSIDMYKAAAVWRDFYYTYTIGAEEATVLTNDVKVEPQDNAATVTWPTNDNAATYTIQITKDGVVFCTLIFNANGQLTGIAFAPGKNGNRHAPAAKMTANGLQFKVTGLNSATHYNYTLQTKDASDNILASYSGEFTTTSEGIATGVDNVPSDQVQSTKIFRNGQIFILRGDKVYNAQGALVK